MSTIKIRRKVDRYRKDKGTSSLLLLSLLFIPSSVMCCVFLGLFKDSWWFGLAGIVISVYPWLLMLCRINVFSDDSIPRYEDPKMSIELGSGYVPIVYWLLSFQIGLNVTGYGITGIGSYLNSATHPLFFAWLP